jgi:kynurenine 3-monooxygenase
MRDDPITIVGSGLAGALLACLLGRAGRRVALFERRADPRQAGPTRGRSINLALSTRGIHALREVGLLDAVLADAVIMRGRMIHHPGGALDYQPYGTDDTQVLHSVSRAGLNRALIEHAATVPAVEMHFEHRCRHADPDSGEAEFDTSNGTVKHRAALLIGADGAYSAVRASMQRRERFDYSQEYLDHGYKELTFPPGSAMERHALHIWPRGGFMLIALPNADGSFTGTLFAPYTLFDAIAGDVRAFFRREFADAELPDLEREFAANPTGALVTIRCRPWHVGRTVLVGDACHAVVPFLGQGMNAAFEDCCVLAACLAKHDDPRAAFVDYEGQRRENCDVLARLCLDNFVEMRDRVGSRLFVLGKRLSLLLMRLVPGYVPLYNLVEFTRVGYAEAERRVILQGRVLAAVLIVVALLVAALIWRAAL